MFSLGLHDVGYWAQAACAGYIVQSIPRLSHLLFAYLKRAQHAKIRVAQMRL